MSLTTNDATIPTDDATIHQSESISPPNGCVITYKWLRHHPQNLQMTQPFVVCIIIHHKFYKITQPILLCRWSDPPLQNALPLHENLNRHIPAIWVETFVQNNLLTRNHILVKIYTPNLFLLNKLPLQKNILQKNCKIQ